MAVTSPLPMSISRTESVAEKMLTNWFTFLLYKFLKVRRLGRRDHPVGRALGQMDGYERNRKPGMDGHMGFQPIVVQMTGALAWTPP